MPLFNLCVTGNFEIKMFHWKTISFPQRSEKQKGESERIPPNIASGKSLHRSVEVFLEMAILTEKDLS